MKKVKYLYSTLFAFLFLSHLAFAEEARVFSCDIVNSNNTISVFEDDTNYTYEDITDSGLNKEIHQSKKFTKILYDNTDYLETFNILFDDKQKSYAVTFVRLKDKPTPSAQVLIFNKDGENLGSMDCQASSISLNFDQINHVLNNDYKATHTKNNEEALTLKDVNTTSDDDIPLNLIGVFICFSAVIFVIFGLIRPSLFKKNGAPLSRFRIILLGVLAWFIGNSWLIAPPYGNELFGGAIYQVAPICLVFLVVLLWKNKNKARPQKISQEEFNEAAIRASKILNGEFTPIQPMNIFLKNGEVAIFEINSLLAEVVSNKEFVAGSVGASFRVAKGLTLRTGGTKGGFITKKGESITAQGKLTITTNRIIFSSSEKAISIPHNKIIHFSGNEGRLVVNTENRQAPYFFHTDPPLEVLSVLAAIKYAMRYHQ